MKRPDTPLPTRAARLQPCRTGEAACQGLDGSNNMVQQIVNAERDQGGSVKQYIDEHVMMRVADRGSNPLTRHKRTCRLPLCGPDR